MMLRPDAERIFDEAGCLLRNVYPHFFSRDAGLYAMRKEEWIKFIKNNQYVFEAVGNDTQALKYVLKGVLIGWVALSDQILRNAAHVQNLKHDNGVPRRRL